MDARAILLVALGGALGAVARYGVSLWLPGVWPTLAVNLLGSFALGLMLLPGDVGAGTRLFVAVGVLGAFTTLSTYSVEVVDLLRAGEVARALLHMLANGVGGPLLAAAGWWVGSR